MARSACLNPGRKGALPIAEAPGRERGGRVDGLSVCFAKDSEQNDPVKAMTKTVRSNNCHMSASWVLIVNLPLFLRWPALYFGLGFKRYNARGESIIVGDVVRAKKKSN